MDDIVLSEQNEHACVVDNHQTEGKISDDEIEDSINPDDILKEKLEKDFAENVQEIVERENSCEQLPKGYTFDADNHQTEGEKSDDNIQDFANPDDIPGGKFEKNFLEKKQEIEEHKNSNEQLPKKCTFDADNHQIEEKKSDDKIQDSINPDDIPGEKLEDDFLEKVQRIEERENSCEQLPEECTLDADNHQTGRKKSDDKIQDSVKPDDIPEEKLEDDFLEKVQRIEERENSSELSSNLSAESGMCNEIKELSNKEANSSEMNKNENTNSEVLCRTLLRLYITFEKCNETFKDILQYIRNRLQLAQKCNSEAESFLQEMLSTVENDFNHFKETFSMIEDLINIVCEALHQGGEVNFKYLIPNCEKVSNDINDLITLLLESKSSIEL